MLTGLVLELIELFEFADVELRFIVVELLFVALELVELRLVALELSGGVGVFVVKFVLGLELLLLEKVGLLKIGRLFVLVDVLLLPFLVGVVAVGVELEP